MSTAENVLNYCKEVLELELDEYQILVINQIFNQYDRAKLPEIPLDEWRQIPECAEFEINGKGEVRNVLTKLPVRQAGGIGRAAVYLRDNAGVKRMYAVSVLQQKAFPDHRGYKQD